MSSKTIGRGTLALMALLSAMTLAGCAASAALHPKLASQTDAMRVRGSSLLWQERLSFGPFEAALSSGIPWERVSGDLADAGLARQRHRFALSDGTSRVEASCATRQKRNWSVSALRRPSVVHCSFKIPDGGQRSTFSLEQTGLKRFAGSLRPDDGTVEIRVESEHPEHPELGEDRDFEDPLGYTMTRDGAVIAEVATRGGRRVWIDPVLPQSDRMHTAAIAAALLLFEPAEDD